MGNICESKQKSFGYHLALRTWNQNCFGLYDFSSKKNITRQDFYINQDTELLIEIIKNDLFFVKKEEFECNSLNIKRISFNLSQNKICYQGRGETIADHVWRVLQKNKLNKLSQSDFLWIGKIVFRVQSISTGSH